MKCILHVFELYIIYNLECPYQSMTELTYILHKLWYRFVYLLLLSLVMKMLFLVKY